MQKRNFDFATVTRQKKVQDGKYHALTLTEAVNTA